MYPQTHIAVYIINIKILRHTFAVCRFWYKKAREMILTGCIYMFLFLRLIQLICTIGKSKQAVTQMDVLNLDALVINGKIVM